ncbi:MAG: anthranilate synthase component I family protein [Actinobacteria bacterium]|nr:anthranilate synthase component I family protein [Actinomycetota bacterium]
MDLEPVAVVGGHVATGLVDVTSDLSALDGAGWWVVALPYRGEPVCARFERRRPTSAAPRSPRPWCGPAAGHWLSSLTEAEFSDRVRAIRHSIALGDVYQVNLTRQLRAPLPRDASMLALGARLARGNPAPYAATIDLPGHGLRVASASPELFLSVQGRSVRSSPIKGTTAPGGAFSTKDHAENIMIVDLVRNDLGRVCEPGSVQVPDLLRTESHPGLSHLVSTVEGQLRDGCDWSTLLEATFPAGSVTGAPKIAAMAAIDELETVERGMYCGAIGWVDADRSLGELNVGIRTFWVDEDDLCFGTGGAITWDSTPEGEWAETELKAARLIDLASGTDPR